MVVSSFNLANHCSLFVYPTWVIWVTTKSKVSWSVAYVSRLVQFHGVRGGFGVFAVFGEESSLGDKKSSWGSLFDVEDPRSKVPQCKGKFLDVYQALEVARYDIQYCDWRARQDLLTIMLLHEKVFFNLNLIFFFWELRCAMLIRLVLFTTWPVFWTFDFGWFFLVTFDNKICVLWSVYYLPNFYFFQFNLLGSFCFFIMVVLTFLDMVVGSGSFESSSSWVQVYWHHEKGACRIARRTRTSS